MITRKFSLNPPKTGRKSISSLTGIQKISQKSVNFSKFSHPHPPIQQISPYNNNYRNQIILINKLKSYNNSNNHNNNNYNYNKQTNYNSKKALI